MDTWKLVVFRSIGMLFLAVLWLIFYVRERRWWMMLMGIFGILVFVVGLLLSSRHERLGSIISAVYMFLVMGVPIMAQSVGFRPSQPIHLGSVVIILLILVGCILLGSVVVVLAILLYSTS